MTASTRVGRFTLLYAVSRCEVSALEFALVNNPLRAGVQRYFEAPRLLAMGGPTEGGSVLEMGCGRGVGTGLILDRFEADRVDAFDLDPRMVRRARRRLTGRADRVRLWVGDASTIARREMGRSIAWVVAEKSG